MILSVLIGLIMEAMKGMNSSGGKKVVLRLGKQ
jgi:hypothetical protein